MGGSCRLALKVVGATISTSSCVGVGYSTSKVSMCASQPHALNSESRNWALALWCAEPTWLGSEEKANTEFMLSLFRAWGWNAHIETFDVLYPTPTQELVEMVAPTTFKASLHEPPIKGDATSSLPGALPPYNVYGADGDVTAPLVYVNYGMPDDYKELARYGIDVKGKIVIVRYGGGWRG